MELKHDSVLLDECIKMLKVKECRDGIFVDGTLGGGGHSADILNNLSRAGRLIGIDQDDFALDKAGVRLNGFENKVLVKNNFKNIQKVVTELGIDKVDGILLDLGASSFQFDDPERGFSYNNDAMLDMRMDKQAELTAYDIVNRYDEKRLTEIIYKYGEEKWAKRIAQFIINERNHKSIETTLELVSVIKKAVPKGARKDGPHPAKRTFQALRIEVNDELGILENTIKRSVDILKPGGRLCIITFHSPEDSLVKNCFRRLENPCDCPIEIPVCVCGKKPLIRIVEKKGILPSDAELERNHRARSAKLRIAEKI